MPENKSQTFVAGILLESFYKEMEEAFKEAVNNVGKKDVKKTLMEIIARFALLEIHIRIIRIFMLVTIGFCLYFLMSNLFLVYILSMEANIQFLLYSLLSLCFVISMNYFKAVFKGLLPFLQDVEKRRKFYVDLFIRLRTIDSCLNSLVELQVQKYWDEQATQEWEKKLKEKENK